MESYNQQFTVSYQYPVHFTDEVFDAGNQLFAQLLHDNTSNQITNLLFVIDSNVAAAHTKLVQSITNYVQQHLANVAMPIAPVILSGGEIVKNDPEHLEHLYQKIARAGLCRHSYLIAIGGGALLDLAGYAAATAHRGIRLIRMPTTVLSQNDSGVGVKTAINTFGRKNFLGTFTPPFAVINDFQFLTTLDDRDWRAGISEAIKVGLIKDDKFFGLVFDHANQLVSRDMKTMRNVIERTAELHLKHIASSGDPFELGTSRPLDFGHWAAHKLEQMTNYELRHGEAVAIGMALDSTYSNLIGELSNEELESVLDCISRMQLPTYHHAMEDHDSLLTGLDEFREHLGGPLTIALLRGIGQPFDATEIDRELMVQAIRNLEDRFVPASGVSNTIRT